MAESYTNCCGSCIYLDLYDKMFDGTFHCTEKKSCYLATEPKCGYYRHDNKRTNDDIEKARKYSHGLA